ncbi:MAG: rhodanese-like domain-containing protein [Pseudobdellovibrionaceae bacterium]
MNDTKVSISAKDLLELIRTGKVTVVDVRSDEEFGEGHIWEAVHLPISTLPSSASKISKTSQIVTVCNKGGGRSEKAASLLREAGWNKTCWLEGGLFGWVEAGYSDFEPGFVSS